MRLPLPACGERVGVRGPMGIAQNRGCAPSPARLRSLRELRAIAPSTMLRMVPLPCTACRGGTNNFVLAMRQHPSFARTTLKKRPPRKGAERRQAHPTMHRATHPDVASRIARARKRADRSALAFRRSAAALARPVATSVGSAPDPRFLRPGLAGVTRVRLSRVYRAPRGPVVVPVGRGPRAARERFARPRAGTALAPLSGSHLENALRERDSHPL